MALAADDQLEIPEGGTPREPLPLEDDPEAFSHLTLILAARAISAAEADVVPAAG